jgi:hypothetical protein
MLTDSSSGYSVRKGKLNKKNKKEAAKAVDGRRGYSNFKRVLPELGM